MRSRAVSFPLAFWAWTLSAGPPRRAASRVSRMRWSVVGTERAFFRTSATGVFLGMGSSRKGSMETSGNAFEGVGHGHDRLRKMPRRKVDAGRAHLLVVVLGQAVELGLHLGPGRRAAHVPQVGAQPEAEHLEDGLLG